MLFWERRLLPLSLVACVADGLRCSRLSGAFLFSLEKARPLTIKTWSDLQNMQTYCNLPQAGGLQLEVRSLFVT